MTAPKFTHHDRLLLAGMAMQGMLAHGYCELHGCNQIQPDIAKDAVGRADDLLIALADSTPPECVADEPGPGALLGSLAVELERGLHSLSNAVDNLASKSP